jgi:hypothetical protein
MCQPDALLVKYYMSDGLRTRFGCVAGGAELIVTCLKGRVVSTFGDKWIYHVHGFTVLIFYRVHKFEGKSAMGMCICLI